MGFFKRLFGEKRPGDNVDEHGLYFYVECDRCQTKVRVRADKQHDLNRIDGGFVWHKVIVDNRCFRQMPVVVRLSGAYEILSQEIEGGRFITQAEFEASEAGEAPPAK